MSTHESELLNCHELLLETCGEHPVRELAALLGDFVQVGCDSITLMTYFSIAGAHLGQPFNQLLTSDNSGADRFITDRLVGLCPTAVEMVDHIWQFRGLAKDDFKSTRVVIIRERHEPLYRYAMNFTCADLSNKSVPSILLHTDEPLRQPSVGPTLSLRTEFDDRIYTGFGPNFATARDMPKSLRPLSDVLSWLDAPPDIDCTFAYQLRAPLRPEEMIVVNRLMNILAAIRGYFSDRSLPVEVTLSDYALARDLLGLLPVASGHDSLSPYAVETANSIYYAVKADTHQLSVADRSAYGNKFFTMNDAKTWSEQSYSGARKHLRQLEQAGILIATIKPESRNRGKEIHYCFPKGARPPFGRINPYLRLPSPQEIAQDCTE